MARRDIGGPAAPHIDRLRKGGEPAGRTAKQASIEACLRALRTLGDENTHLALETGDLDTLSPEIQHQLAELGRDLLESNRVEEARIVFEGLAALNSYEEYYRLALGVIAQRSDDPDEAVEHYSEVLRLAPRHPTALAHRGEVLLRLDRTEEGWKDLLQAVEVDPEGLEPTTHRARALLATMGGAAGEAPHLPGASEATPGKTSASMIPSKRHRR